MNPLGREYKPSEVAALTGVGVDKQRDWRRSNFLSHIGSQNVKGRWEYSAADVSTLFVMNSLSQAGLDLRNVAALALKLAGGFSWWAVAIATDSVCHAPRFALIRLVGGTYQYLDAPSIPADLPVRDQVMTLIDYAALAGSMNPDLRAIYFEIDKVAKARNGESTDTLEKGS